MQSKTNQETNGIAALYCRLSRDDGGEGDSISIIHIVLGVAKTTVLGKSG